MKLKNVLDMLKGSDRYETAENYALASALFGGLVLSSGIAAAAVYPKGISAILAMMGTLIAFLSTVILIIVWIVKDFAK
jgi:hypothetical protein